MIQKPISVMRVEFISDLVNLINNAELPSYVIEPILKNALDDVRVLMNKQYNQENAEYQHALSHEIENQKKVEEETEAKDNTQKKDKQKE